MVIDDTFGGLMRLAFFVDRQIPADDRVVARLRGFTQNPEFMGRLDKIREHYRATCMELEKDPYSPRVSRSFAAEIHALCEANRVPLSLERVFWNYIQDPDDDPPEWWIPPHFFEHGFVAHERPLSTNEWGYPTESIGWDGHRTPYVVLCVDPYNTTDEDLRTLLRCARVEMSEPNRGWPKSGPSPTVLHRVQECAFDLMEVLAQAHSPEDMEAPQWEQLSNAWSVFQRTSGRVEKPLAAAVQELYRARFGKEAPRAFVDRVLKDRRDSLLHAFNVSVQQRLWDETPEDEKAKLQAFHENLQARVARMSESKARRYLREVLANPRAAIQELNTEE